MWSVLTTVTCALISEILLPSLEVLQQQVFAQIRVRIKSHNGYSVHPSDVGNVDGSERAAWPSLLMSTPWLCSWLIFLKGSNLAGRADEATKLVSSFLDSPVGEQRKRMRTASETIHSQTVDSHLVLNVNTASTDLRRLW
jgi:hypothetical protein